MRAIISPLFLVFILIVDAHAQDLEYAKSIVKSLASPEFKGRGYVENGDKIAADYIAEEFKKYKILPIGQKSHFQKFSFSVNTFPGSVSIKLDQQELQAGVDYLIDASSPSISGRYKIIKTSRQDIDTEEKLVALIRRSAGAFIFIDNSEKVSETKDLSKRIDDYITFLRFSDQIPTKGIILYGPDKLTWSPSSEQGSRPVIRIRKELDLNQVNIIDISLEAKFNKKHETQNIVGQIMGTSTSDSTIVLTAHYDHLGKMGKEVYFPGANDNASGVAMLLNLAQYYAFHPPQYNTVFIAFAGEEIGLLGSQFFTENPLIDLKKIKFLINFDLAGTGEEGIRIVNGSIYKDKFDRISAINQEQDLLAKVDIRGEACNSDHCMFHQKGVPCFYIYTQGGIQAYHDVFDKSETLPLTEFVDYCKLMIAFLATF